MITEPGLYQMSDEEYFADPVEGGSLTQSRARVILAEAGPAKFRYQLEHPRPPSDAMEVGKAAHFELFGEGTAYEVVEDMNRSTKVWKELKADSDERGVILLQRSQALKVQAMAAKVKQHPAAAELLGHPEGLPEYAAISRDEQTGVMLRCKFDWITPDCVVDYKTTRDASAASFAKSVLNYGYAVQDAWYRHIARDQIGPECDRFILIVQDSDAPYEVAVYELDHQFHAIGERDMRRAIDLYAECQKTGVWPGYGDDVIALSPPAWALRGIEDQMAADEIAALEALIEGNMA